MSDLHQEIAVALDQILNGPGPKKNGFVLLTFPFDAATGTRINYVRNAERRDMLVALKEVVARFEGQAEQRGSA